MVKLCIILASFGLLIHLGHSVNFEFTSISCTTSNKSAVFTICGVHGEYFDLGYKITRKMNKFYVSFEFYITQSIIMLLQANITLSKMENEKYRQLFKIPPLDWCPLMSGGPKSRANPLIKSFLMIMKAYAKDFIHDCPYVFLLFVSILGISLLIFSVWRACCS